MSGRVQFVCDGAQVEVDAAPGETLLSVLRERLGIMSVKDGCAPQGQCGCCTVLVDGDARVACVTPVARIAGRSITTVDGLLPDERDRLTEAFAATGGSQCGFCTPGIVVRAAALQAKGPVTPVGIDRALAAHLCRCTGWRTVVDAMSAPAPAPAPAPGAVAIVRRRGPACLRSKVVSRSRWAATWCSAAAGSPMTPRPVMRSSRCRGRPGVTRRVSRRPGWNG